MSKKTNKYKIIDFDETLLNNVVIFLESKINEHKNALKQSRSVDRELTDMVFSNINRMKEYLSCIKQYLWLDKTQMDSFDEYLIKKAIEYYDEKDLTNKIISL